jgi:class 3 adenylate cyclase
MPSAKFCPECGTAVQRMPGAARQTRKRVTIVFSDLVGSTSLGEELDAESLREVLDGYFDAMRRVLESHGAVVEKYIGDAVMAIFGLPRMHEDDALRAVRAAVGMRDTLADLNEALFESHGVRLRSRTGVNTGVVVVGDVTDGQRLATGDAVNVAARLEQAAAPGGIVLGPDTFRLVKERVVASAIGPLSLKGKVETIDAWQLVGLATEVDRSGSAMSRPLIGRSSELASIESHLDLAGRLGRVDSLLVVGEPGVGKSRLIRAVVDCVAPTSTVLFAACRPYGSTTFAPLAELLSSAPEAARPLTALSLRTLAAQLGSDDGDVVVARVGSLLGLTDEVFPLEECFWATSRLLASITPDRPLLLVVEDVHWAEETMLDLVSRLQRNRRAAGALVVATGRPEALERQALGRKGDRTTVLQLSPLTALQGEEVIRGVLGGFELPRSVRELLQEAAEGNPLFLEQALAAWVDEGVLVRAAQGWTLTRPVIEVAVPASVSAAIAARLDRLGEDERLVLGAASVAGPVVEVDALRAMLEDLDEGRFAAALVGLRHGELLMPGGGRVDTLRFGHAALRDVSYEMSLKSDRATSHERLAGWMESRDEPSPPDGVIGHHLAQAYSYRRELRRLDAHTRGLALRGATHLVPECLRSLRIGDRMGANGSVGQIVDLLSGCGADLYLTDLPLMEKTAKLLVRMGRWPQAVELLSPCGASGTGPLLRDLGVALCQLHRAEPESTQYREGQRLLAIAAAPPWRDTDALASLAGSWKGIDVVRAQALYRQCLDLDPSDPYPLGNMQEYDISTADDLSVVDQMRDAIIDATRRCRAQADAGANLPWAFFDAGKFALLSGRPYEAVASYAKAVQLATADHMLVTSMASLRRLEAADDRVTGLGWVRSLLAVARAVAFPSEAALAALGTQKSLPEVNGQLAVVFLAGGTDASAQHWLERHAATLREGFSDFRGLLVSGGTDNGIAGLAGALRERASAGVTAVGYLPAIVPPGTRLDGRYDQLRRTSGQDFSIAETLQAWTDLVSSGAQPADVKLLALNGGEIAAAEYRVALALGCSVGVVVGSGREADRLLDDLDWVAAPNLTRVDADPAAIRRFLSS